MSKKTKKWLKTTEVVEEDIHLKISVRYELRSGSRICFCISKTNVSKAYFDRKTRKIENFVFGGSFFSEFLFSVNFFVNAFFYL